VDLERWVGQAVAANREWAAAFGPYTPHPSLEVSDERFGAAFAEFTDRLGDNYPFFHPRYAGQMLKPPHPAAVAGYLAAMLINPNNHALDGGPATARMEREVTAQLAAMFGFGTHLGHLTTSGTVANLEALFVARELHPGRGVAFSADAHYTHSRMCGLLGVESHPVAVDRHGRMDLDALDELLRTGRVGTVVLTAGTTGLGAIDPIHEALGLCRRHGARIHVDAAYGGFFAILARADGAQDHSADGAQLPSGEDARDHGADGAQVHTTGGTQEHHATGGLPAAPWRAIAECDSVVVDPHKHGLQPYGCGAVLFRDPGVARFYLHDSPYTYFTSADLHLGEISLECSRAGAAAAALWLTFRLLPPTPDGLGQVLAAGRRAALAWSALIRKSAVLELYQQPELDIVSYFPVTEPAALSRIDQASERILQAGMTGPDPVFLSTLRADAGAFLARHGSVRADTPGARILRSVLMKPEAEDYVPRLHERLEQLARG
jgi:glutamate/tyrosine decarboxylase-like PLP-dependent enzyme